MSRTMEALSYDPVNHRFGVVIDGWPKIVTLDYVTKSVIEIITDRDVPKEKRERDLDFSPEEFNALADLCDQRYEAYLHIDD